MITVPLSIPASILDSQIFDPLVSSVFETLQSRTRFVPKKKFHVHLRGMLSESPWLYECLRDKLDSRFVILDTDNGYVNFLVSLSAKLQLLTIAIQS